LLDVGRCAHLPTFSTNKKIAAKAIELNKRELAMASFDSLATDVPRTRTWHGENGSYHGLLNLKPAFSSNVKIQIGKS
jgi:hypothetical protein